MIDMNHSDTALNRPAPTEDRSRVEPEEAVFFHLQRLMGVSKEDGVDVSELSFQPAPKIACRPPPVDDTDAKAIDLKHPLHREPAVDVVIIHVARDGLQRILLKIIKNDGPRPIPQMNHHVGIMAILFADRSKLIGHITEMSIGHYHKFHVFRNTTGCRFPSPGKAPEPTAG